MRPILILMLSDDESQVIVLGPSGKVTIHTEPVLQDVDGEEAAIRAACLEAVRAVF